MWIKTSQNNSKNKLIRELRRILSFKRFVIFILCFSFIVGLVAHKAIHSYDLTQLKNKYFALYLHKLGVKIDPISIDIKFKDYQKLEYKRAVTLSAGTKGLRPILFSTDDDYVKAKIRYQNKNYKIKMRLKGDWADHIANRQWSFRVKIRDDKSLFGMNRFSLNAAHTRNYLYEWMYYKILANEELIALRSRFVKVTLNGKCLGIYALEEHFSKELIENNRHREGPIIKFSEDVFWEQAWGGRLSKLQLLDNGEVFLQNTSEIMPFGYNKILSNPIQYSYFLAARNLLEGFRLGQIPASQVFDKSKMSRFIVLSQIMGAWHALRWHNLRFYYNPITRLIEPIGYDGSSGKVISDYILKHSSFSVEGQRKLGYTFYHYLFKDKVFLNEYIKVSQELTKKEYLDDFFNNIENENHINLSHPRIFDRIYRRDFYVFSKSRFYTNQNVLSSFVDNGVEKESVVTYKNAKGQKKVAISEKEKINWLIQLRWNVHKIKNHLKEDKLLVIKQIKTSLKLLIGLGMLLT